MLRIALNASVAALLVATGCNAYDPNLGASPFRCAAAEPRCPDGYECVSYSPTDNVCELEGSAGERPDAGAEPDGGAEPFQCADDAVLEPNDSLNDPTLTPIPTHASEYRLVGLAICPEDDADFFRFDVDQSGKDVLIQVDYLAQRGELLVDLLNSSGVSISQGTPAGGDANVLRMQIPNVPQNTYYVHVRSNGAKNNYSLQIAVSGQ